MAASFTRSMVHQRYDDLRQLRSCFDGWDAELIQIRRGDYAAWTSVTTLSTARIVRVRTGRAIVIRGVTPMTEGCAIFSARGAPVRVLGQPLGEDRFAVAGGGARIDLFVPADATLCLVISSALAEPVPRKMEVRTGTCDGGSLVTCIESAAEGGAPRAADLHDAVDETGMGRLLAAIETSAPVATRTGLHNVRAMAVMRASRFIDARLRKSISLGDLSKHCRVGMRTLEYGFRQLYDSTPIGFVKSQRLCRTHDALQQAAGQRLPIQQIAQRAGFTHMGQFAQDYRRLFGETPSQTLQQARQRWDTSRNRSTSGALFR